MTPDEKREKCREAALKKWADPEFRKKQAAARKRNKLDPTLPVHEKLRLRTLKMWQNPEYRARQMASRSTSPAYAGKDSPRAKRIGELARERWADPAYYAMMCAAQQNRNSPSFAIEVTIHDKTYTSVGRAARAHGVSEYKIRKYVETGILPLELQKVKK